ncbi:TIR domain-containing protein [Kordia sp. TARA_039_SRF]|nr:TIR domain-containing protein [Kordia sp. TARA_039_SRF]
MAHLIFLSHIHEEKDLAKIVQNAIESEFSGFVKVFVSSDGSTIPAGANFLKRIEDGLVDCIGGIYLISPKSVKRNWINFELGAVWIRNVLSLKNDNPEIPTIPFCHSGITPSKLPMPLTNLSAIEANNSAHLESAFKSIQTAVGGSGELKTDFDKLASEIINFEKKYTLGDNLVSLFQTINVNSTQIEQVITRCKGLAKGGRIKLSLGFIDQTVVAKIRTNINDNLSAYADVMQESAGIAFGNQGAINGGDTFVNVSTDLILEFEELLKEKIK